MTNIIIYLCAINIMTFLLYGLDKQKAKRHKWRIPEATLLGVALAGGSIGAFLECIYFIIRQRKQSFILCTDVFVTGWASLLIQ